MSTAIKLDGAENVYIRNVQTSGFDNGILAKDASGVIEGYQGDPISLRNQSNFQIVDSRTSGLEVDNSVVELYDTIAGQLLEVMPGTNDPVLHELRYYADRVIDCRSQSDKEKWVGKLKNKFKQSKPYLDMVGYGNMIYQILRPILGI